ncbi:dolichyl-phosphate beta-glucosyltransferase [Salpingoeca rosetta]|uniref:Dolichyl-phosphate beta-glucosyltransferase n=1 Tax=Salpingoeca rosetta (strain ATCC 50818 / BSB-021) TaxID=946362 RepID=F2UAQ7_SALR5|nr:dolichyl-phosphate beta-glucosyltransferase [Salpingoeca rosetta]EGD73473.1 dolichyl-phosphate beta-glucosyltransferase [Salpingoeca rosetta]|eukprot:XP_004993755.1 dolichyl-phosphate beta-glucosyltransferase [Salpingoeca rosetta]
MLSARGRTLLMADADAATDIRDLPRLQNKLNDIQQGGNAVVVGSRAHLVDEAVASRSVFRTVLMFGFHFLVSFLCVKGIKDTQCGFKLFTRKTAKALFTRMHIERWAFDVELLYMAQRLGFPAAEVAVNWKEVDGSKVDPLLDAIQMARDLVRIRALYMFGFWSL